ncbi:hypothetical protein TNCV_3001921 [Trichonephila clavipes]|nr:hypothetical protein TNCV_3001921 [Trichonephila clavipes]
MGELYHHNELHTEQEVRRISLEALKTAQKYFVVSDVEQLTQLMVKCLWLDLSTKVGLEGYGLAKKQGFNLSIEIVR